ncbi:MAG: DUF885 family protein [Planctomycetota bacterium]
MSPVALQSIALSHKNAATSRFAVAFAILLCATAPTTGTAETKNLRMNVRWLDSTTIEFRRQADSGAWQTIRVDALTGDETVIAGEGAAKGQHERLQLQGGTVPRSGRSEVDTAIRFANRSNQAVRLFWVDSSGRSVPYHRLAPGEDVSQHTYVGHAWKAVGEDGTFFGSLIAAETNAIIEIAESFAAPQASQRSRERKNERDGNPAEVRQIDASLQFRKSSESEWHTVPIPLGLQLHRSTLSPDGGFLAAWFVKDFDVEKVHTIESSPKDGGRARVQSTAYRLPGDPMDTYLLKFYDIATAQPVSAEVPVIDFGRPRSRWRSDHRFIFEKVDRGHQRFRVFAVDLSNGEVTTPIDESSETFLWTTHGPKVPLVTYLTGSNEAIYASERSGYRHLYRVDLDNESRWHPITSGDFVVRQILHVDEDKRTIDAIVGGIQPKQDPYHRHLIRVGIDTGKVTVLTEGNGDHEVAFSPDRRFVVVNHSRVDSPPIHELRNATTGEHIATLATAKRVDAGHRLPKPFVAKGRDGETDIWGLICFPTDYDESKIQRYPVIENIYAGPHDSHVPKRYRDHPWHSELTDLGFMVVQIDGMGTANRSKAFHDVCWQNLKDAGFPDRIAWMKEAARLHPAMDLERVGIYGTSAGGQNACGALLFHGDFYQAAMASCGCHDNRMDKASWNEQWMGYPVGDHYAECSNIENAHRLKGDLLLLVGELDSNVPPESTLRLVDALIQADKRFEFLLIPGMGHSDGGTYGRALTRDFFVRKLRPPGTSQSKTTTLESLGLDNLQPVTPWDRIWDRYQVDRALLKRRYSVSIDPQRHRNLLRFSDLWERALAPYASSRETSAETVQRIAEAIEVDRQDVVAHERIHDLLAMRIPLLDQQLALIDVDQRGCTVGFQQIAQMLPDLTNSWSEFQHSETRDAEPKSTRQRVASSRAGTELIQATKQWRTFYADYDPEFDWWVSADADRLLEAMEKTQKSWGTLVSETEPRSSVARAPMLQDVAWAMPNYPNLDNLLDQPVAWMPRVMEHFRKDTGPDLKSWRASLSRLNLNHQGFDAWCQADQADWHRLTAIIQSRLSMEAISGEPTAIRGSRIPDLDGAWVGRDRLKAALQSEMIGNTPEELIALAESEYVACREAMVQCARDMGLGDDWQSAVERIKTQTETPGRQPNLIRDLAEESIAWLRAGDWMTVDPMAASTWRMQMMSPKRQLVNPFFTGGEVISVSFPTRQMKPEEKRQSLRGNNRAFARATVHHELIPGHHYQAFQNQRHHPHRQRFPTPFWLEGWAVYWEFLMYENGFARTPEERLGFLVWRAHRYARILFSLRFHLGQLGPDECVQFLIDNVGFDPRNSAAEVRRSIGPDYPPLYQAAYMIGAMQFRQLAKRWESENKGTLKEFHDAVMRQGPMPLALLQAVLFDELTSETPTWRFESP